MDFIQFQNEILNLLNSRNKECLELIERNKNLIQENLGENGNAKNIIEFVKKINDVIINENQFDLVEQVLYHPYFSKVLKEFVESDVLIRACKIGNKNASKWLLTMKVSPYIQDNEGKSALMYATHYSFNFVIEPFLQDARCINLLDKNDENVLFYCLRSSKISKNGEKQDIQKDLILNSKIDINQVNLRGETVLLYCIKNNIIEPINKYLLNHPDIDVNISDNDGNTAAMYFTEMGLCSELLKIHRKNCNYEFINGKGQSVISILMRKLYSVENENSKIPSNYEKYIRILTYFVLFQLDTIFNYPVDEDENTAFMTFLIVNDLDTAKFCCTKLKKIDLSIKNRYGENATSLCYKLGYYNFIPYLKENPTFNEHYRDPINQNTLFMISSINNFNAMNELLENEYSIINEINRNEENTLIIATKMNNMKVIKLLLERGINVYQQDYLGNTALHYAIELEDLNIIYELMKKRSNIHLKNNEGKSPLDYVIGVNDKNPNKQPMLNILLQLTPPSPTEVKKETDPNSTNYYESIQKYLIPYANNYYPEFKLTTNIRNIKSKIFKIYDPRKEIKDDDFLVFMEFISLLL